MKRIAAFLLLAMLAVTPVLAETTDTPMPGVITLNIGQEMTIGDVLSIWRSQEDNLAAFETLSAMAQEGGQPISADTLLRIVITCCLDVNPGSTCTQMADYLLLITVGEETIDVIVMTQAKGFVVTVDAFTGEIVGLMVDEEVGVG